MIDQFQLDVIRLAEIARTAIERRGSPRRGRGGRTSAWPRRSRSAPATPMTASSRLATTSVGQWTPEHHAARRDQHGDHPHRDRDAPPDDSALRVERGDERHEPPTRGGRERVAARERRSGAAHQSVADRAIAVDELLECPTPRAAAPTTITTMASARRGQRRHASSAAIAATTRTIAVEPKNDTRRASVLEPGRSRVDDGVEDRLVPRERVERAPRSPSTTNNTAATGRIHACRACTRAIVIGGCRWRSVISRDPRSTEAKVGRTRQAHRCPMHCEH